MALSKSLQRAQAITQCQFCEESQELKYKCVECDLLLCKICNTTLHRKKAYFGHKVIILNEFGTTHTAETIRKVGLTNMLCEVHPEMKCCVYCSECEEPICADCLLQCHCNHNFTDLEEVYNTTIAEITALKNRIQSDLPFFKEENEKLQSILSDGEQHFQATRNQILQQDVKLKEIVTKQSTKLLHNLDTNWHPAEGELRQKMENVKKIEKDLESRRTSLEQVLLSLNVKDIFVAGKSLDKMLPGKIESDVQLKKTIFVLGKEDNQSRDMLFGSLYHVPIMKMIESFNIDFCVITNLSIINENTAYIVSALDKRLLKIHIEKPEIKVLYKLEDIYVYDMAVTKNGDVLISTNSKEICLFQKTGQMKTFHSFSPLYTMGLHITNQNEILLGLTESIKSRRPPRSDSIRKVVSLTENGDIKDTYEYDKCNRRLFSLPCRICSNDSLICIVDRLNVNKEGRLVAIDKVGQLLWTYIGFNITQNQNFFPRDIVFTLNNLILTSDSENHAIHFLNFNGEIIAYKCLKDLGIELPFSLDVDKNGILWIGGGTYTWDERKKTKIYKVKLT